MTSEYYKRLIAEMRKLIPQAGGEVISAFTDSVDPEQKSESGQIEVQFSYGTPQEMRTPDGTYKVHGTIQSPDKEKYWELFESIFLTKVIYPGDGLDAEHGPLVTVSFMPQLTIHIVSKRASHVEGSATIAVCSTIIEKSQHVPPESVHVVINLCEGCAKAHERELAELEGDPEPNLFAVDLWEFK